MKKRLLFIEILLFSFIDKVYAVNKISCGSKSGIPEGLPPLIRTFISLIEYMVPLGIILFGSVDFFKVVLSGEKKDLDKATSKFIKRTIAGSIVFFVVFITLFIFKSLDNSSTTSECIKCFAIDKEYCVVYDEAEEDHSSEKIRDIKEREELEKKRESNRQKQEEKAKKEKEKAAKEKDPDEVLNGKRNQSGTSNPIGGSESNIDYIQWAINLAKDDSWGYGHTYPVNTGGADTGISCSGLVGMAIQNTFGVNFMNPGSDFAPYLGMSMAFYSRLSEAGFERISATSELKSGDILVDGNNSHVYFYAGNGFVVEANGDYDNVPGDSSKNEVVYHKRSVSPAQVYRLRDDIMKQHTTNKNPGNKTIIFGDSRTVGMTNCCCGYVCEYNGDTVIASSGHGYDWMLQHAIVVINSIIQSDPDVKYNIISLLGVNDMSNIDNYIKKYNELATGAWKNHNLILVSVNPVDYAKELEHGYGIKPESIVWFNAALKAGTSGKSNITYCDTYSKILYNFGTTDGLHYDDVTYQNIYNYMKECI